MPTVMTKSGKKKTFPYTKKGKAAAKAAATKYTKVQNKKKTKKTKSKGY